MNLDFPIDPNFRRNRRYAFLVALAFFVAIAPTLGWQEFSNSMENLVLATSMETRRGGSWLVPTLQGELRVAKPPLAAWITAGSIRPGTLAEIDSLDHNSRQRGFFLLALQSRWPALLAATLMLLGVFELGRCIRDSNLGLVAMLICASSYFLLRFSRYASTDIYLALWVTWTNAFLARAILRQRYWSGLVGAGFTLGMAMITKGPVSVIESVVPVVVFMLTPPRTRFAPSPWSPPALLGFAVFLITGFWWFALVIIRKAGVLDLWYSEVFRSNTGREFGTPILTYLGMIYYVVPWTAFLLVGLIAIGRQIVRGEKTNGWLALLLLIVPLIVMTFAKDRQDRYALPMIGAAAVVIAIGVREYLHGWMKRDRGSRIVAAIHWIILTGIAVVVPMLATTPLLKQENGQPWFTQRFGAIESALGAGLVLAGIALHRKRAGALVTMTFVTMLVMQAVLFKGYCSSGPGRSDMKHLADAMATTFPDATYYNAHPKGKRPPTDLGVYLNRTIRWIPDASTIKPTDHAIILFMLQNNGEPDPTPPEDWHFVEKAKRDKDWWWAFVLPPT